MRIKNDHKVPFLLFLCSVLIILSSPGCGKKEEASPPPAPAPPVVAASQIDQESDDEEEKPIYVYTGDRLRDPFTTAGASSSYQPDAVFNPQRIALKGIIYGRRSRSAIILVSGTGAYFIKGKRIFDVMGKTVDGFTAKVFIDKIVVFGEADVYEFKLRDDDDEEEKT